MTETRSLLPVLKAAAPQTGGLITVEEHTVDGGLGGAAAEVLLESPHRPEVFHRIGLRDGFSSIVGSQQYLRRRYQLDAASIADRVSRLLQGRRDRQLLRSAA